MARHRNQQTTPLDPVSLAAQGHLDRTERTRQYVVASQRVVSSSSPEPQRRRAPIDRTSRAAERGTKTKGELVHKEAVGIRRRGGRQRQGTSVDAGPSSALAKEREEGRPPSRANPVAREPDVERRQVLEVRKQRRRKRAAATKLPAIEPLQEDNQDVERNSSSRRKRKLSHHLEPGKLPRTSRPRTREDENARIGARMLDRDKRIKPGRLTLGVFGKGVASRNAKRPDRHEHVFSESRFLTSHESTQYHAISRGTESPPALSSPRTHQSPARGLALATVQEVESRSQNPLRAKACESMLSAPFITAGAGSDVGGDVEGTSGHSAFSNQLHRRRSRAGTLSRQPQRPLDPVAGRQESSAPTSPTSQRDRGRLPPSDASVPPMSTRGEALLSDYYALNPSALANGWLAERPRDVSVAEAGSSEGVSRTRPTTSFAPDIILQRQIEPLKPKRSRTGQGKARGAHNKSRSAKQRERGFRLADDSELDALIRACKQGDGALANDQRAAMPLQRGDEAQSDTERLAAATSSCFSRATVAVAGPDPQASVDAIAPGPTGPSSGRPASSCSCSCSTCGPSMRGESGAPAAQIAPFADGLLNKSKAGCRHEAAFRNPTSVARLSIVDPRQGGVANRLPAGGSGLEAHV
ncbi:uncharacterized protein PSFLO_04749 [Pseudozyma flocculosa]|uniref:Uncharacterized protein n=1 Tax=Pseudozyma flocculosa TaxID=84751 RepID=A0A5C3F742_9BASI|nr:uncharacterized protein PSFLO_04749 [Pseudozyma flocculosa]